jgi:hypothetical protein
VTTLDTSKRSTALSARLKESSSPAWAILILTAVIAFAGDVAGSPATMWLSGVVAVITLIRIRTGTLASPVVIPMLVFSVVGFAGYRANSNEIGRSGTSYYVYFDAATNTRTFGLMCFCAIVLGIGALFTLPGPINAPGLQLDMKLSDQWSKRLLILCWLTILLTFYEYGFATLKERTTYQVQVGGGGIISILSTLTLAAVIILGFLFASSGGSRKIASLVAAVLLLFIYFSLGSRRMAIWPMLFVAGYALSRRNRRAGVLLVVAAVVSIYLIRVPLYLRGSSTHGWLPYSHELGAAFTSQQVGNAAVDNIVTAYPIIGSTGYLAPAIPHHFLLTELDPLPGRLVGWYNIEPQLRLNSATPYSTIGELGNHGYGVAAVILLITGAYLGFLQRRIRFFTESGRAVLAVVYLGFTGLFSIGALQYDMRSSYRSLYYLRAVDLVLLAAPGIVGLPRKRRRG